MLAFAETQFSANEVGGTVTGFPCAGPVTQVYGIQSVTGSIHAGTDIGVPSGTKIRTPADGTVDGVYTWGTFGNWVVVYHGWDNELGCELYAVYAHLMQFNVIAGQSVFTGDLLGLSDNTGLSTGPHLHWGISRDKYISGDYRRCFDPYFFVQRAINGGDMPEYTVGLMLVANGDFRTMLSVYDGLSKAGFFANLDATDPINPIDPDHPEADDLNDSVVRVKRITWLAFNKELGPSAWKMVKGS